MCATCATYFKKTLNRVVYHTHKHTVYKIHERGSEVWTAGIIDLESNKVTNNFVYKP